MAGPDKHEKTEKPTPKKIHEARKEGRIPKSPELVSWISILIGVSMIKSTATRGGKFLTGLMTQMGNLIQSPDQGKALSFFVHAVYGSVSIVAPLTITFMTLGIVGHLAQVRFVLAFKALKPSFKKINPLSGAKRLFSKQSTFMAGKQMVKTVILSYVAYRTLWATINGLTKSGPYSTSTIITITSTAVVAFIREIAAVGIVIGIIDYFFQRRKMGNDLKMTKHEVKQESKNQEMSAEVRGARKRRARELSRNRMMAAIKDADVVIVNPIHVAVAIKYTSKRGAPRVVAKGAGFIAEKIRERAEEENVPMVQDVPLARTLHRLCDVDDEIPGEMFESVAKLLAFVFSLKARGQGLGFHKMPGTPEVAEYDAQQAKEAAAEAAKRFNLRPDDLTPVG